MPWVFYLLLLLVPVMGPFFSLIGPPGLLLMVRGPAGYAWITGLNHYVGWPGLITVFVLASVAEIVEFFAGTTGAKRAGASRRAMIGAVVGALIGGFLFTIPVPILGTIFGVCFGAFVG